jgi:hypothetical protein
MFKVLPKLCITPNFQRWPAAGAQEEKRQCVPVQAKIFKPSRLCAIYKHTSE